MTLQRPPPPPIVWAKNWAERLNDYLVKIRTRLPFKDTDHSANEEGLLLYDRDLQKPVYSKNNRFVTFDIELQNMTINKSVTSGTLDAQTATFVHSNVELVEGTRITILVGALKGAANDAVIHTAGSNYAVGDTLNQSGTTGDGSGFACTVTKVNSGGIVAVDITNAGSNYIKDEVITLGNVSSSGSSGKITVIASNSSTTPTLQVDSLGTYTITRQDGTALSAGDIRQGQYCDFVLDVNSGTPSNSKWRWLNSPRKLARLESPTISNGSLSGNISGSPDFLGTPTAPTASVGTNTTQLATTAFVKAHTDALVGLSDIAQTWRLQANVMGNQTPLTNFAVANDAAYGSLGTTMGYNNSTGVFTFPEAGFYVVLFQISLRLQAGEVEVIARIQCDTQDGDGFTELSQAQMGNADTNDTRGSGSCFALIDVKDATDVSNFEVRFVVDSISQNTGNEATSTVIDGSADTNVTSVTFVKIANT